MPLTWVVQALLAGALLLFGVVLVAAGAYGAGGLSVLLSGGWLWRLERRL